MRMHKEPLWVVAFDGGKALIFENTGPRLDPALTLVAEFKNDNPPDREHTTDAPGRLADGAGRGGGAGLPAGVALGASSVEQTDAHAQAEARFVSDLVSHLNEKADADAFGELVLMAAPQALGLARPLMGATLKARLVAEDAKDVVGEPSASLAARTVALLRPD